VHVLKEKPFATTLTEAQRLAQVGEFSQWKHLSRRVRRIPRRASSSYESYGVGH
jgi:hypothetical protein